VEKISIFVYNKINIYIHIYIFIYINILNMDLSGDDR
jgi:hypothetical protein